MPTYPTPSPVALRVRIPAGDLRIDAEPRDRTEVEVAPHNPSKQADVEFAAATTVEQRGDDIVVTPPRDEGWLSRTPKLSVRVRLPAGSLVSADVKSADVTISGPTGHTEVATASGDLRVDHAASLEVTSASGDVFAKAVDGTATVKTASGDVRLNTVDGDAEINSASGDVTLGRIGGDASSRTASGDVTVESLAGSASARTASGDIRLRSVRQGEVEIDSASGDVWIGVLDGTAAWLEVNSLSGDVSSDLEPSTAPDDDAPTVTIRARTLSGDIAIRRATS